MVKQIIEKHMDGKVNYKNIKYKFGGKKFYNCAMFEIKIPLRKEEI